ncbi:hypothetical protein [Vibrio anguillarum]|uniref:hypothetical protein n=1 Tax=Vibrio anguillarum TaxID=55601 RepID=UPI000BB47579|nr:hypothetical protein [Vibrio anguillarum]ATC59513.1 hypothetical protein CMV05_18810 [Vibrio anguillarum]
MSGEFVNTRNLINSKHDDLISDNDTTHANRNYKKAVLDNTYGINTAITFLSRLENKVNADFSVLKMSLQKLI